MELQAILQLIRPTVADVHAFLWSHIQVDLALIGRAVDRGRDDVLLLVHSLLSRVIATPIPGKLCFLVYV